MCACMCFWHFFFSVCVSVLFYFDLLFFFFNLTSGFSKEREKESMELDGWEVWRIWEEMRKGK